MSVKFDFKSLDTGFEADWPVTVGVQKDGGVIEEQTFMARFKTPSPAKQEELKAIEEPNPRLRAALKDGFVGFATSEGETLTDAMFDKMWGAQNVQLGLIRAFMAFQTGTPAKN